MGKRKTRKLLMMVRTWTNWNLIRNRSGRAGLKEGAVVTVGEQPPQKKRATGRKVRSNQAQPSEERKVVHRYAIGEEQP
jgi:hypothetical protein